MRLDERYRCTSWRGGGRGGAGAAKTAARICEPCRVITDLDSEDDSADAGAVCTRSNRRALKGVLLGASSRKRRGVGAG